MLIWTKTTISTSSTTKKFSSFGRTYLINNAEFSNKRPSQQRGQVRRKGQGPQERSVIRRRQSQSTRRNYHPGRPSRAHQRIFNLYGYFWQLKYQSSRCQLIVYLIIQTYHKRHKKWHDLSLKRRVNVLYHSHIFA